MNEMELVSHDPRGWIQRVLKPGGSEVIFIFTKAGFWRGGEYHRSTQSDFVVFGKLHWLKCMPSVPPTRSHPDVSFPPEPFWSKYDQSRAARTFFIAPYEAHVVRAEEDTLYVEWIDGEFEKTYVPEMRILVDRQLEKASKETRKAKNE